MNGIPDSSNPERVDTENDAKVILTLSGGGMRAVVFHLGVLQKLATAGLLERVTGLSTVSGGSLAAALVFAHSRMRWPSSTEYTSTLYPNLKQMITRGDLFSLRALGWRGACRYNRRILYDRARILADQLRNTWHIDGNLNELPDDPIWYVNTTCFETGKNWRFSKREMGDWRAGRHYNPPFTIAEVTAASAAVPYAIGALRLGLPADGWHHTDPATRKPVGRQAVPFENVRLWDGGAYENLGLEAFYKLGEPLRRGNFLICSDASGPLNRPTLSSWKALFKCQLPSPRLFEVSSDQIRSLRSRMLVSDLSKKTIDGVLVRMGNSTRDIDVKVGRHREPESYDAFLPDEDASAALAYPTDLQAPSERDFDRIARHGFEATASTLEAYAPELERASAAKRG